MYNNPFVILTLSWDPLCSLTLNENFISDTDRIITSGAVGKQPTQEKLKKGKTGD